MITNSFSCPNNDFKSDTNYQTPCRASIMPEPNSSCIASSCAENTRAFSIHLSSSNERYILSRTFYFQVRSFRLRTRHTFANEHPLESVKTWVPHTGCRTMSCFSMVCALLHNQLPTVSCWFNIIFCPTPILF